MTKFSKKILGSATMLLSMGLLSATPALAQLPNGFIEPNDTQITDDTAGFRVFLPLSGTNVPNTLFEVNNPTLADVQAALEGFTVPEQITDTFPSPNSSINVLKDFQPGNPINGQNLLDYNFPDPNGPELTDFPWRPGFSSGLGTVGGNVDMASNLQTNTANWDTDTTAIKTTFDNFGEVTITSLTRGDWFNQIEGNSIVLETDYNQANNTQFAKAWVNSFFDFYDPLFQTTVEDVIPGLEARFNPAIVNTPTVQDFLNSPIQTFLDDAANDTSPGSTFDAEFVYNELQENPPGTNISGFQRISNPNLSYVLKVDKSGDNDPIAEEFYEYTIVPSQTGDQGLFMALETTYFGSDTIFQITQGETLRQAIRGGLNDVNDQIPFPAFQLTPAQIEDSVDEAFAFFLANPVQLVEPIRLDFVSTNSVSQDFSTYQFAWQAAVSTQFTTDGLDPDFPPDAPLNDLEFLGQSYSGTYDPLITFPVPEITPPPQTTPEPSGIVALLGLGGLLIAKRKQKQS